MKKNWRGSVVFADRKGMGAGKGDCPRNTGPAFKQNFDQINWSKDEDCPSCGHVLCTCS